MTTKNDPEHFLALLHNQLRRTGDQTVYLSADSDQPLLELSPALPLEPSPAEQFGKRNQHLKSLASSVAAEARLLDDVKVSDFERSASRKDRGRVELRVQATKCFRGEAWSVTLRGADEIHDKYLAPTGNADVILDTEQWWKEAASSKDGYAPCYDHVREERANQISLASYGEIGDAILDLVRGKSKDRLKGFIYITGETKSGKSSIARGMIYKYLESLGDSSRKLHLVTYEDPIEKWFYTWPELQTGLNPGGIFDSDHRRVDYTPREKGIDCNKLTDCTKDALRQTPTVLLAGEIRDKGDLGEAVRFGGTGHLIVATGHAGSLFEAAEQIFAAMDMSNAARRAAHAPKILAIVHLKSMTAAYKQADLELTTSMVVPTIYRRCPLGMQGLVSDGLASLLPNCPAREFDGAQFGSLGRQFMVRKILKKSIADRKVDTSIDSPIVSSISQKKWDELCTTRGTIQAKWATEWPSIRLFHAAPREHIRIPENREFSPLWMKCAEDDINGFA